MFVSKITLLDASSSVQSRNRSKSTTGNVNFKQIPYEVETANINRLASELVSLLHCYNGEKLSSFLKSADSIVSDFKSMQCTRFYTKYDFIKKCLDKKFPKPLGTNKEDYNKKINIIALRCLANLDDKLIAEYLKQGLEGIKVARSDVEQLKYEPDIDKSLLNTILNEKAKLENFIGTNSAVESIKAASGIKSVKPVEGTPKTEPAKISNNTSKASSAPQTDKETTEKLRLAQTLLSIPKSIENLKMILENIKIAESLKNYVQNYSNSILELFGAYNKMQAFNDNNFQKIVAKLNNESIKSEDRLSVDKLKINIDKKTQESLFGEFSRAVDRLVNSKQDFGEYKQAINQLINKYKANKSFNQANLNELEKTMDNISNKAISIKKEYIDKKDYIPYNQIKGVNDIVLIWKKLNTSVSDSISKIIKDYNVILMTKDSYNLYIKKLQEDLDKIINVAKGYKQDLEKLKY